MHKFTIIVTLLLVLPSRVLHASAALRALATRLAVRQQTIDQSKQFVDHKLNIEEHNDPEQCLLGQIRTITKNTLRYNDNSKTQLTFKINRQKNEIYMHDTVDFLVQLIDKMQEDNPISTISCKFDDQNIIIKIAINNSNQKKKEHNAFNKKAAL